MSDDLREQSANDLRRVLVEMEALAPPAPELEEKVVEVSTRSRSRPRPALVAFGAAFVVFLLAAPLVWLGTGRGGNEADDVSVPPADQPGVSPATTLPSPETTAPIGVEPRELPRDADGIYTYAISYFESHQAESTDAGSVVPGGDVSIEAEGTLTYTVEDGPEEGMWTVSVQAIVSDLNQSCGHPECSDELFEDIPEYQMVIDSKGNFVRTIALESDKGLPALVIPEPLPGSNLHGGLPFVFGPPLPEDPLHVGDTWTTSGPRSAFNEDGPQFSAEHTVTGTETLAGRDTVVISSVYQTPAPGTVDNERNGFGTETAEVTVWFDPNAGIILRAELERTDGNDDGLVTSTGTTQIVVELTDET